MLKSCFNAYVLSNLDYCAPVWVSSAESRLGLLDSVARSAERLCEGELCCLGHIRSVSVLYLLYRTYNRADPPLPAYLHHFVQLVIPEL